MRRKLPVIKRLSLLLAFFCVLFALPFIIRGENEGMALWPEASGEATSEDGKLLIDAAHAENGYFLAACSEATSHRLKLRVEKEEKLLTYDLNGEGEYEVFPLQMGSGEYVISLYETIGGKKYSQAGKVSLSVELVNEDISFLYPNQYVNYTELSPLVEMAESLEVSGDEKEAYDAVQDFMSSQFVYDYVRAVTVSAGSLPELDDCYDKRMGICQDLAAVMVGMLRSRGIPSRLVIGYADDQYHAWTVTSLGEEEVFFDPTAALDAIAKPKDYSVERVY